MAHILIVSESDPTFVIKIEQTEDGEVYGVCNRCGEKISDRNHFGGTIHVNQIHVDRNDCWVILS